MKSIGLVLLVYYVHQVSAMIDDTRALPCESRSNDHLLLQIYQTANGRTQRVHLQLWDTAGQERYIH